MPYNQLFAALLLSAGLCAAQQFFSGDVTWKDLQEEEPCYCAPCSCPVCPSIIEPLEDEEATYATEESSQAEVLAEDG